MADSLKEIIAKLKQQQAVSQQSQQQQQVPIPQPQVIEQPRMKVAETPKVDDADDEYDGLGDEEIKEAKEKTEKEKQDEQVLIGIEMLQNTGRYRMELLNQLQEINRALVIIAGVLVDITGNGKK